MIYIFVRVQIDTQEKNIVVGCVGRAIPLSFLSSSERVARLIVTENWEYSSSERSSCFCCDLFSWTNFVGGEF